MRRALRQVFLAAIKTLLRGKTLLQALLAFWTNPSPLKSNESKPRAGTNDTVDDADADADARPRRSRDAFLAEVSALFLAPVQPAAALQAFAASLKAQFATALRHEPACMLPSYNHQLPSGAEHGRYLALDVGGSTLRVALVELRGRVAAAASGGGIARESEIVRLDSFRIDPEVKALVGTAFFDWMARKIVATVSTALGAEGSVERPLLMGLAWSFPIEQISHKGGKLQGMGKGFLASDNLIGHDLGSLIQTACARHHLHVELGAIVNDSTAALLAQAYHTPATRFGLILGTGVNIAVHLPVAAVGRAKFGARPAAWFAQARCVVVNTELGMFGRGILPLTRWDAALDAAHLRPGFQPLEHLVSGFYMGEVCRLVLVEAVQTAGVLGGVVPSSLEVPYSLDTETLSIIEADTSESLAASLEIFHARHAAAAKPTPADMSFLRTLASHISRRSSALVAASLFALWQLKNEAEAAAAQDEERAGGPDTVEVEVEGGHEVVAFNGSVIEQYPGYLQNCQRYIDELLALSGEGRTAAAGLRLVGARESSLLGAAVALACLEEGRAN